MPERYLGRVLGKYRLTRLLGAGAFAWVYEAVDLDLEIPVALKVLRPEFAGQPAAEARFRREATTAARLRHPNIVFIRDVGEGEGTVFVAMDLLPLSLARRLEVFSRLAEPEVVRFALEVAAALSIAHADGVVHRDIKPDNVMLGSHGEAIVADFGLAGAFAKLRDSSELDADEPGKVMGTPHYFSPEQARGLELDGRSDLYSLGIMCYRAATGTLPFEGDDWYTVARQHVEDTPVPPRMLVPELTEGFEAIVLRLLAKNPEHRFASATQLADALLTLPTAPPSHSASLTPSSASITQVAFPYLHSVRRRSWKRTALIGSLAIMVTAAVALMANAKLAGLPGTSLLHSESIPTTSVKPDSTPLPSSDSIKPLAVAALPNPVVTKAPVKPATATRPPPPPTQVNVTVAIPDSINLWVNEQPRQPQNGTWQGSLPIGAKQHFVAQHERSMPGCKSAQIDTTITFISAQANLNLDLAPCSVLLLTVENSSNAQWTLTSRNFAVPVIKPGSILGVPTPITLRNGEYELLVTAEKCNNWTGRLTIARDSATGSDTVRKLVPLNCPTPELRR